MEGIWLIAFLVQWALLLFLAVLVAGVLRQLRFMQERWQLAAPPVTVYELHQQVAEIVLPDVTGRQVHLSEHLARGDGGVILFVTPTCSSCATVLAQVSELISRQGMSLAKTFVIIVLGNRADVESILRSQPKLRCERVALLSDEGAKVAGQFAITVVPTGLAVDSERRVLDQTFNPHAANWIYKAVSATPPLQPVTQQASGLVVPTIYSRQERQESQARVMDDIPIRDAIHQPPQA